MFGDLSEAEIENVLHHQILGRIGCHVDQITYIVPCSYAYDGDYIYVISQEGMKLNIMRKNPQVCFEVEEMPDMANWKTVVCWGEFEELSDPTDRHLGLELLYNRPVTGIHSDKIKLSPVWPFHPENIDQIEGVVFRIKLTRKTGRFERHENTNVIACG